MRGHLSAAIIAGVAIAIVGFDVAAVSDGELWVLRDSATPRADREIHDVDRATLRIVNDDLHVAVEFRRPLVEMACEAVEIFLDCDADRRTGLSREGFDLRVCATVGSPFSANSWPPAGPEARAPLEQRRCSFAFVHESPGTGGVAPAIREWAWRGTLQPPTVAGSTLSFTVPVDRIREGGWGENRRIPLRIVACGICAEHPIPLRHLASDVGVGIRTDGRSADWSGGTRADDDAGDLHPDAAVVDIRRVQVDHDAKRLHVGVWLARPGFGTGRGGDEDVVDLDRITVAVEPLDGDYAAYREHHLETTRPNTSEGPLEAVAGNAFAEFAIDRPRATTQNDYRIVVWSEARREDRVPDTGTYELDMRGAKRE